ncbi:RNA polymerase sigma factor, partial [Bacillus sp. JJ722]|uniref:RNA polymerase sigma factor n=1 Tax=Bacillus sp. JJ722 TaxID=3122973 RepID=UPI002FFF76D9
MYTNITKHNIEELSEDSTEELIKEYHQKIYIYCYNILRNTHDAEDAVQEVFIKAFQSSKLMKIENKSAW